MDDKYYGEGKHSYMLYENDRFAEFTFSMIPKVWDDDVCAIELGAGMGRFSAPIVNSFKRAMLVEPNKKYAEHLEIIFSDKSHVSIHCEESNEFLSALPTDKKFVIFLFHLFHHLSLADRKRIYSFVKERNTIGFFVEPNPLNPFIPIQIMLTPDMSWKEEHQYVELGKRKYQRELHDSGLRLVHYNRICPIPPGFANRLLQINPNFSLKSFEKVSSLFPFLASYQLGAFSA